MHVVVTRLFDAGRPIPRWQLTRIEGIPGELSSDQVRLDRMMRPVPCLRLLCPKYQSIELLEPRFTRVIADSIAFAGFEIGGMNGNQYVAQSWLVQLSGPQ